MSVDRVQDVEAKPRLEALKRRLSALGGYL